MENLTKVTSVTGRRMFIAGKIESENGETGYCGYASMFSEKEPEKFLDIWNEKGEHNTTPEWNFLPEGIFGEDS